MSKSVRNLAQVPEASPKKSADIPKHEEENTYAPILIAVSSIVIEIRNLPVKTTIKTFKTLIGRLLIV